MVQKLLIAKEFVKMRARMLPGLREYFKGFRRLAGLTR